MVQITVCVHNCHKAPSGLRMAHSSTLSLDSLITHSGGDVALPQVRQVCHRQSSARYTQRKQICRGAGRNKAESPARLSWLLILDPGRREGWERLRAVAVHSRPPLFVSPSKHWAAKCNIRAGVPHTHSRVERETGHRGQVPPPPESPTR